MGKPDNPRAFPLAHTGQYGEVWFDPGMDLRDYFAGQALAGMLQAEGSSRIYHNEDKIAEESFALADAMLEEREKDNG